MTTSPPPAGGHFEPPGLAGGIWVGSFRGGLEFRCGRASIHRDRRSSAGIFRRDAAQRSARHLDSRAAGAPHRWRWRPAAPVCRRLAAGDRPLASGRFHRRHGAPVDRNPAAMDGTRFRLSVELDAGRDSHASQTGDQRGSGGRGSRGNERRVRPQPADSPRGLRHGAADCVRQRREPAAGPRGVAARTNRSPSRRWVPARARSSGRP